MSIEAMTPWEGLVFISVCVVAAAVGVLLFFGTIVTAVEVGPKLTELANLKIQKWIDKERSK